MQIPKRKNIRSLDALRGVLERIYLYGFYSRDDFLREKLVSSARFYDDVIRQLRDLYFLDEIGTGSGSGANAPVMEVASSGKFRRYRFRRDYFSGQQRNLRAVYGLYSIRPSEISILIYCLSLASSEKGTTVSEVVRAYELNHGEDGSGGTAQNEIDRHISDRTSSVSRRFSQLQMDGYILPLGKSNKRFSDRYHLSSLSDRELLQLYSLAKFFGGAGFPRVSASFLADALLRMLRFRGLEEPPETFLFRGGAAGNTLDEQIVTQLIQYCRGGQNVRVTMKNDTAFEISPVFLRPDTRFGRWYLLCLRDRQPLMLRLSRIASVQKLNSGFDRQEAETHIRKAFGRSHVSGRLAEEPVRVEAQLFFDEPQIRRQFEREILFGQIEQRDGGEFYCAEVNDALELLPLLRAYGPWLRVLPGEGHDLPQRLRGEYERMLAHYGTVQ